jgi:hypothetical protein
MRYMMKKTFAYLLALLTLVGVLSACGGSPSPGADDFSYAAEAFSVTVRGTFTPVDGVARPIAAVVEVGAPVAEDGTLRPLSVSFTQPPSLAGVTVRATVQPDGSGALTRTVTYSARSDYGTVTAESAAGAFDGLLRFAEALLPHGDVVSISPVNEDGTHTVTRKAADGSRTEDYLFARGRVIPLRARVTAGQETIDLAVDGLP